MRLVKSSVRQLASRPVRTQLDNGAVVITHNTNQQIACVGLVSRGGSRLEGGADSAASLNRSVTLGALDATPGASVSSVLHRERVGVYATTTTGQANDVAAKLVDAAQVRDVSDANRAHAQAALNGASGNVKTVMDDYAHMTGFMNTPLGASPFGTTTGIEGTSNGDVLNFRENYYQGGNVTLVGTGTVDHDALCKVAEQLQAARSDVNTLARPENCQFTGTHFQDRNDFLRNTHVKWSWNVPGLDHAADNAAFAIMAEMFGAWNKGDQHAQHSVSKAVQWVANCTPNRRVEWGGHNADYNPNRVRQIEGQLTSYSDTALFGFYCEVVDGDSAGTGNPLQPNRVAQVTMAMHDAIKGWSHGFSEHEIAAAKNSLLVKMSEAASNPLTLADSLGAESTISGNARNFGAQAGLIEKVTSQKMTKLFFDWIYNKEIVSTYYGATEGHLDPSPSRHRQWDILKF